MSPPEKSELSPESIVSVEKTSLLKKVGSVAVVTGIYVIPVAISVGSAYYGIKILKMNNETAKLNLEVAKAALPK